jgi:uncharacterized protein (TIGR03437 family)
VTIGGEPAEVLYSGITAQYPGLYQVNVRVREGTPVGYAVPVELSTGGKDTTVTIAVQ